MIYQKDFYIHLSFVVSRSRGDTNPKQSSDRTEKKI